MPDTIPAMERAGPILAGSLAYACAAALGLALCLAAYPPAFLFPAAPTPGPFPGDMAQHVIGQRYFFADAWRWHPLMAMNLNTPGGTNIAFTDSIPLLALVLKPFAPLLPAGFEGIGLWYGISCVLQPVAAVWAIRAAGERRLLPSLCFMVVAASMPFWWNRYGHAALTGQFTILIAIGEYFVLLRARTIAPWIAAALVQACILLIHPYFWIMTIGLPACVPVTLRLRGDDNLRTAVAGAGLTLLVSLLAVIGFGYIGAHGGGGFDLYGMNLLSPFWPANSSLLPWDLPFLKNSPGGGWEGYTYLGAGAILALLTAIAGQWPTLGRTMRRHAGLVLLLAGLTAVAASNTIGIGRLVLHDVYPAPRVMEHFRSSARFFWTVGYVLSLAGVLGVSRIRGALVRIPMLILIAMLEFIDAKGLRAGVGYTTRGAPASWSVDATGLRQIFARSRQLTILPHWNCMPPAHLMNQQALTLQILTLASETAIPANTMYLARWYGAPRCEDEKIAATPLRAGEVRILLPEVAGSLAGLVPDSGRNCAKDGLLTVCSTGPTPPTLPARQ
jgi:hypothetical protein